LHIPLRFLFLLLLLLLLLLLFLLLLYRWISQTKESFLAPQAQP
jgi:hypothetical protein